MSGGSLGDYPDRTELAFESAVSELAQCLHEALEKFDPSVDGLAWDELTEFQRETYGCVVRRLFINGPLVQTVLDGFRD
ncbi:MAG: hypothetical protein NVSMB20_05350 [Bradyrhizobium sp.]